jgi:hypothetical protein
MTPGRTPQQLDPLGTYAVWALPAIAGSIAVAYAICATLWHSGQFSQQPLAWLGVGLVVIASALFVWASLPRRAPLTRTVFVGVLGLALLGSVSFTAATWGHNRLVQDDWGQIVTGLFLLAMAQLRPVRELLIAGCAAAAVLGLAAAIQFGFLSVAVSPVVYGLVAATPPLAMAFGAAAYSHSMLKAIGRWQDRARASMQALEPQVSESVGRSVQQEFVTVLNRDAAPLLERILAHGEITSTDLDAAAVISRTMRMQTVDTLDSSWLDDSVRRAGMPDPDAVVTAAGDRQAVAAVTADQRAVFGALLMALTHSSDWAIVSARATVAGLAPGGRVAARGTSAAYRDPANRQPVDRLVGAGHEPQRARLTLIARIESASSRRRIRRACMPYLSVLRMTSTDARMRIDTNRIEVGFSYDLAENFR